MSRSRRPFLYDRYLSVTVDLLRSRGKLEERDYKGLAIALARMREQQRLTAWAFLPDHWHAIIYPPHPLSISRAMSAVKVSFGMEEMGLLRCTHPFLGGSVEGGWGVMFGLAMCV